MSKTSPEAAGININYAENHATSLFMLESTEQWRPSLRCMFFLKEVTFPKFLFGLPRQVSVPLKNRTKFGARQKRG
jgi:hypothetical protein